MRQSAITSQCAVIQAQPAADHGLIHIYTFPTDRPSDPHFPEVGSKVLRLATVCSLLAYLPTMCLASRSFSVHQYSMISMLGRWR
jgi:hypothetical protein